MLRTLKQRQLDQQPYVHIYDSVSPDQCRIPDWIADTIGTRNTVVVQPEARTQARLLAVRMTLYRDDLVKSLRSSSAAGSKDRLSASSQSGTGRRRAVEWGRAEEDFWAGTQQ